MADDAPGSEQVTLAERRDAPPRLADGVELIGEYEGSGYREPPSLARRGDGQMIQLTPLLYLVAKHADGARDHDAIAAEVTEELGRAVSGDNVRTLVDDKLRPLGVLAAADGSTPEVRKPDPLLALRFRKAILSEERSRPVASLFKPLFLPPVVLAALAALVVFDVWLFTHHGVAQGFREALYQPALILLVLAMVVVSAGWHEFGHAAGCAYGGARPGAMGAGIYLVYPVFYTDVTDSYRLGRAGRLRTDLAGVYFNGLFILSTAGLYAVTGSEALLLVIVVQHIEIAHQLLPFLRLDGYYIVADLTGVPDLFSRIKPILASMVPGRRADRRVAVLKPWVRVVVTLWVLAVVPLLVFQVGLLLLHAPRIFATAWDSLGKQAAVVSKGVAEADLLAGLAGALQSLVLVVPLVGIALSFARLGGRMVRRGWRGTDGRPVLRSGFVVASAVVLGALAHQWVPNGDYEPIQRGERGTLGESLAAVSRMRSGRASLVPRERAEERGELGAVPAAGSEAVPAGATTEGGPAGADGTGADGGTATTAGGGTPAAGDGSGTTATTAGSPAAGGGAAETSTSSTATTSTTTAGTSTTRATSGDSTTTTSTTTTTTTTR